VTGTPSENGHGTGPDEGGADAPAQVRCPVCLDSYPWSRSGRELFELDPESLEYRPIDLTGLHDPVKLEQRLRSAFLRCPNPSQDTPPHYLPLLYGGLGRPLVIGLVGATRTGKTHLLAAMLGEVERGGLQPYGLTAVPLDQIRHRRFYDDYIRPLYHGTELAYTAPTELPQFVDALIIGRQDEDGGARPVAFFDVSGDLLGKVGQGERFLAAADALIFVVDPEQSLRLPGFKTERSELGDLAFANVLDQLYRGESLLDIPAAIVVAKSDRLRFMPPVDRWLYLENTQGRLDAELIRMESRDVYAFLYRHDARGWLLPTARCRRCTLHFASATGGRATGRRFPRGVRPRRVLEPLVAVLAMTGVLDHPEAAGVGR